MKNFSRHGNAGSGFETLDGCGHGLGDRDESAGEVLHVTSVSNRVVPMQAFLKPNFCWEKFS